VLIHMWREEDVLYGPPLSRKKAGQSIGGGTEGGRTGTDNFPGGKRKREGLQISTRDQG